MELQVYIRKDGKWDWRLRADNHETVCGSDQGYESQTYCADIALRVLNPEVVDRTTFISEVESV